MSLNVSFRGSQERGLMDTPGWMANTPENGGSITMNAVTTIAHAIAFITTQQLLAQHFWIPDRTDRVPFSLARSLATNSCSGQYKLCWPFVRIPCTISSILTTKFIARQFKINSVSSSERQTKHVPTTRRQSAIAALGRMTKLRDTHFAKSVRAPASAAYNWVTSTNSLNISPTKIAAPITLKARWDLILQGSLYIARVAMECVDRPGESQGEEGKKSVHRLGFRQVDQPAPGARRSKLRQQFRQVYIGWVKRSIGRLQPWLWNRHLPPMPENSACKSLLGSHM